MNGKERRFVRPLPHPRYVDYTDLRHMVPICLSVWYRSRLIIQYSFKLILSVYHWLWRKKTTHTKTTVRHNCASAYKSCLYATCVPCVTQTASWYIKLFPSANRRLTSFHTYIFESSTHRRFYNSQPSDLLNRKRNVNRVPSAHVYVIHERNIYTIKHNKK